LQIRWCAVWYTLANGIYFGPRRKVSLHIEDHTEELVSLARNSNAHTFNTYLQDRYNKEGEEKPTFIKHYRRWNDNKGRRVAAGIQ